MNRVQFRNEPPLVNGKPLLPAPEPPRRRNPWLYTPCALGIIAVGYTLLSVSGIPPLGVRISLGIWLAFAAGCQVSLLRDKDV